MGFKQLLKAKNFYTRVNSGEELLRFCEGVNAEYADRLGIFPSRVSYSEDETDFGVGTSLGNRSIEVHPHLKSILALMQREENGSYPYYLFDTIIHETKHNQQRERAKKILENPEQYSEREYLISLAMGANTVIAEAACLTLGWSKETSENLKILQTKLQKPHAEGRTKLFFEMMELIARAAMIPIYNAEVEELIARRKETYENQQWEVDAREFTAWEMLALYRETKDPNILSVLDEFIKTEQYKIFQPSAAIYEMAPNIREMKSILLSAAKIFGKTSSKETLAMIRELDEMAQRSDSYAEKLFGENYKTYLKLFKKDEQDFEKMEKIKALLLEEDMKVQGNLFQGGKQMMEILEKEGLLIFRPSKENNLQNEASVKVEEEVEKGDARYLQAFTQAVMQSAVAAQIAQIGHVIMLIGKPGEDFEGS